MNPIPLTPYQTELIERPVETKSSSKVRPGAARPPWESGGCWPCCSAGVPAKSTLILVPQRTLAAPYLEALRATARCGRRTGFAADPGRSGAAHGRSVLAAGRREAGFARPDQPPSFLTLETALYYMAHLVRPLLDQGLFDSVTIDRNRIYSQILDNLNKAAIVGFPYTEIGDRLRAAWLEDTAQANVYEDAQRCANLFREYCLQNNLLDYLAPDRDFPQAPVALDPCAGSTCRPAYRHLIYDNIEEDTPVAHDLCAIGCPTSTRPC